jgi:hypothetical protein
MAGFESKVARLFIPPSNGVWKCPKPPVLAAWECATGGWLRHARAAHFLARLYPLMRWPRSSIGAK